ncbi:MAG TPA: PTS sugar transporter subunit IIA, partial [Planctomycetaceae bacterium]|nr:PTS sugar transporter subunit IIA [Planctomycetaceae bacterium]
PHTRNPLPEALGESLIAFGRTLSGIPFGAPKRQLSDLFFLVLCRDSRTHLHVLARLGRIIQLPGFVDELRSAEESGTAYSAICSADERLGADPT